MTDTNAPCPAYLMSYPRDDWGLRGKQNFLSSNGQSPPSPRGAIQDWLCVADAIIDAGGEVVVMPPSPQHNLTGMPYTAEAGEFFRGPRDRPCFQLAHMAAPHRKGEPDYIAGFVAGLGWLPVTTENIWEAQGDAIRVGPDSVVHTWGHGRASRTRSGAYAEVSDQLSSRHMQLKFNADPWFHGNTFLAWFRGSQSEIIMVCQEAITAQSMQTLQAFAPQAEIVPISREASLGYATNALQVCQSVLCPVGLDQGILAHWRDIGLEVKELELPTLFRRGGGAAVCMTNRLWGVRDEEVPATARYSLVRSTLYELAGSYPDTL